MLWGWLDAWESGNDGIWMGVMRVIGCEDDFCSTKKSIWSIFKNG